MGQGSSPQPANHNNQPQKSTQVLYNPSTLQAPQLTQLVPATQAISQPLVSQPLVSQPLGLEQTVTTAQTTKVVIRSCDDATEKSRRRISSLMKVYSISMFLLVLVEDMSLCLQTKYLLLQNDDDLLIILLSANILLSTLAAVACLIKCCRLHKRGSGTAFRTIMQIYVYTSLTITAPAQIYNPARSPESWSQLTCAIIGLLYTIYTNRQVRAEKDKLKSDEVPVYPTSMV